MQALQRHFSSDPISFERHVRMPDLTNNSTTDEAIYTSGQIREPDLSPFSANLQSEHSESFSMMGLRECVGR